MLRRPGNQSPPQVDSMPNGARPVTPAHPSSRRRLNLGRLALFFGPGMISAMAGNDAGGIATYAQAGAAWRYDFVWLMVVITVCLIVVQEMCARMGAVTGKGLSDLIREEFGPRATLLFVLAILIANGGTVVSEFAGISAALGIFGISRYLSVPVTAVALWYLVTSGTQQRVERVFLLMSAVLLVYIPLAFIARPHWGEVLHAAIHPHYYVRTPGYILALVALIGTTITPFMQINLQSSVAAKNIDVSDYVAYQRWDTVMGCIASDLISVFIIVATAVALFQGPGKTQIDSAQQAAQALVQPISHIAGASAGRWGEVLFAIGLLGASVLAGAVLPISTSFAICEVIGWETGVQNDFRDAPAFYIIFTGLLVIGAALALIPGVDPMQLLYVVQAVEGLVLPVFLVFIMLLVNNPEVMTELRHGPLFNILAWGTTVSVGLVALAYVILQYVAPLFGFKLS